MEQTLVILKPDCLQRNLVGKVIERFEQKGFKLIGIKMMELSDVILEEHYSHVKDKPFFPKIKSFMQSSPCVVLAWQGIAAVRVVRQLCGITKARDANPGTIRGDFALSQQYNIIHASDSVETAKTEIKRLFKDAELFSYQKIDFDFTHADDERALADDEITA
ncbi:MAG: nucleoside-diphosphate kinase [bacterium]